METGIIEPLTRIIAPEKPPQQIITAAELDELLQISAAHGSIDHGTGGMLREIIELSQLRVGDIMVPRVDLIAYDLQHGRAGLMELFRATRLRKIPVYKGSIDNITGLVHAKQLLLDDSLVLPDIVRPVLFVPEAGNLEKLLAGLRHTGSQVAIVVDEFGGTAGLVTLEDVLEEIVGELPDGSGEKPRQAVTKINDRQYIIDGNLALHQWDDFFHFGRDLNATRLSTVGGFITSRIGKIAKVGDVVRYHNLLFTVESVHRGRIGGLSLELMAVDS